MKPALILLYCRAGFERECAQEITAAADEMGVAGFVKAKPGSGYAVFTGHAEEMALEMGRHLEFRRLVFARQLVRAAPLLEGLPPGERLGPIVRTARSLGTRFRDLWLEMPDTNEGKALSALTRPLRPHLEKALGGAGVSIDEPGAQERLHAFFIGSAAAYVGVSAIANSAPWPMGIPRLRSPRGAPSRSAMKLAEALLEFVPDAARRIEPGMTAVDLGASPGGWTWQLVQRGFMVTAVDNGAIDPPLLETGQVRHRREDAFAYRPPEPVDWMVCDVVETPSRVARLAARWVAEGWCRETIFNLKLPMKKRWEELERCRALIDEALGGGRYYLRMKQLYHDREEVSVYLSRR